MNVTCENCQKRYSLADEKVRGKTVKVRCKSCQYMMTVSGPPAEQDEQTLALGAGESARLIQQSTQPDVPWLDSGPTAPTGQAMSVATPAVPGQSIQWFAMVRGAQVGPLSVAQIQDSIRKGDITQATFLWRQGMEDWKKGSEIPELVFVFSSSPNREPMTPPASRLPPPVPNLPPESETAPDVLSGIKMLLSRKATREEMAAVGDSDPFGGYRTNPELKAPPGEATRFFILQSGVNRKNPPWKIALFVLGFLAIPVALLYMLSALNIVPLKVTRIDESGQEISEPLFTSEGMSGLADLLTGKSKKNKKKQQVAVAPVARPAEARPTSTTPAATVDKVPSAGSPNPTDLSALYLDDKKVDVGPKVAAAISEKATDSTTAGLSEEAVAKVVTGSQAAFMQCVEEELRKNPNFKGGKVNIIATVGPSGMVKQATIDRRDIDLSNVGTCLKSRAKKMIFPAFGGDAETEVHIPLILTSSM